MQHINPKGLVLTHIFFQNEKCHLLIEHETQKLKELDEEHSQEIKEWREKLRPRKKVSFICNNVHFVYSHTTVRINLPRTI